MTGVILYTKRDCRLCDEAKAAIRRSGVEVDLQEVDIESDADLLRRFRDFVQALAFTNRVGAIAEEEQHHPDIYLAWGKVRVTIWTHAIDGLSRNDFVLAAKIDQIGESR